MSALRKDIEFSSTTRLWSNSYSPVHPYYLGTWREDWVIALRRLMYLSNIRVSETWRNQCLLEVKGQYSLSQGIEVAIEHDLISIWNDFLSKGLRAIHCIERSEEGVLFSFGCREEDGSYLTGRVVLTRRED